MLPCCLSIIVWENPAGQKRDNFANEGGAFLGCRLNNSGVQIVLENSQLHAAAAPPRSRANRLDLAPHEGGGGTERGRLGRLGSVRVKGRREGVEGGERRLFLCVCSRSFIVRSCHTIRPGRKEGGGKEGGWFEHVGSFVHWQRWSVHCAWHG